MPWEVSRNGKLTETTLASAESWFYSGFGSQAAAVLRSRFFVRCWSSAKAGGALQTSGEDQDRSAGGLSETQGSVESSQHPVAVVGAEKATPQEAAAHQLGEAAVQNAVVRGQLTVSRHAVSAGLGHRQEGRGVQNRRLRSGVQSWRRAVQQRRAADHGAPRGEMGCSLRALRAVAADGERYTTQR